MKWLVLDMLIPAGKKTFISAGNYIAGSKSHIYPKFRKLRLTWKFSFYEMLRPAQYYKIKYSFNSASQLSYISYFHQAG